MYLKVTQWIHGTMITCSRSIFIYCDKLIEVIFYYIKAIFIGQNEKAYVTSFFGLLITKKGISA